MTKADKLKIETAALSNVQNAAFSAGESRGKLLASISNACGPRPNLVLFEKVRLAVVVGYMASALARKGDNRTDKVLFTHCRDRILNYQGANGSGKLRNGQKGRRTQIEEDAYSSARVLASRLWEAAGVKVPTKSGTNSNSAAKAAAKKGATGKQAKSDKASDNSKPVVRKFTNAEKLIEYALIQGKAMQGCLNKSAAIAPERLGTAINAFLTEVLAVAAEAGMSV